ncbi:MAG: amino acid degradation protein, partial [Bacillus sp. (in: firmicutes)]
MNQLNWGTAGELRLLLCEVVSWRSMTLTEGERNFPSKVKAKLQGLGYFQDNPTQLLLHDA